MKFRHLKTFEGSPPPPDIFQPHQLGVELLSDMDEFFRMARRISETGEFPAEAGATATEEMPAELAAQLEGLKGGRSVVVVTPGRLIMPVAAPAPGGAGREAEAAVRKMLPPDPPLNIAVVSYTHIKALMEDMTRAIPFLGFLLGFASIGHTVVVFEGHPSAFESGVRGGDVLLVDSGMLPFMQADWAEVAFGVMRPGARILVHDRETYQLRELVMRGGGGEVPPRPGDVEVQYADCLIALLLMGTRPPAQVTSGEPLPSLPDFATAPEHLEQIGAPAFVQYEPDADKVIDYILRLAGWHSYSVFKKTGTLRVPLTMSGGRRSEWVCSVTLDKVAGGRRRVVIER